MKLADVVRMLDKVDINFIADGSRDFLNFAIGYLSSAEQNGRDVVYDQLLEAFDSFQSRCKHDSSGSASAVLI